MRTTLSLFELYWQYAIVTGRSESRKEERSMDTTSERLALPEAARYIGKDLSPHTLRSWAGQGRVSYFRAGRRLFFAKEDLDVFMRSSRVEATNR
jgi:hypothetical protein